MRQLVAYSVVYCFNVLHLDMNVHKKVISGKVQNDDSAQMCNIMLDSTILSSIFIERRSKVVLTSWVEYCYHSFVPDIYATYLFE